MLGSIRPDEVNEKNESCVRNMYKSNEMERNDA